MAVAKVVVSASSADAQWISACPRQRLFEIARADACKLGPARGIAGRGAPDLAACGRANRRRPINSALPLGRAIEQRGLRLSV
jgi:hypothetical protein